MGGGGGNVVPERERFDPTLSSRLPCAEGRAVFQSRLSPGLVLSVLGVPPFWEWVGSRGGLKVSFAGDCWDRRRRRMDNR